MPDALATFPGVDQILTATYSWTRGIKPSVAQIEMPPQANFVAQTGDLVFFDVNGTVITLTNCKVDRFDFVVDQRGQILRLQILDRRWQWEFPKISGHYNLRHDTGPLINDVTFGANVIWNTVKNAQELATLCLQAMKESSYDVSVLPTDAFPIVEWEEETAAQALEQLCEEFGCHVVINLLDEVVVCKVGVGALLPANLAILAGSGALDIPEIPDTITVVSAPTRIQDDLPLVPMAMEVDGTIVPLAKVSYLQNVTIDHNDLEYMHFITDPLCNRAARASVFRLYQVGTPLQLSILSEDGTQVDTITIEDILEIAPLEDSQCDMMLFEGVARPRPAIVYGMWYAGSDAWANGVDHLSPIDPAVLDQLATPGTMPGGGWPATSPQGYAEAAIYQGGFSIDRERCLVTFAEPVFWFDPSSGSLGSANIVLRTSFHFRDKDTRAYRRYVRKRTTGSNLGTDERRDLKEDIIPLLRVKSDPAFQTTSYLSNSFPLDPSAPYLNNINQQFPVVGQSGVGPGCQAQADYYLDGIQQSYQATAPQTVNYAWLQPVSLDGAIFQATYNLSVNGFTTTLSRNTEQPRRTLPYQLRRFYATIAKNLPKAKAQASQIAKRNRQQTTPT